MTIVKIIFWISLVIVFYTYIGYGIILALLVGIKRIFRRVEPMIKTDSFPDVTLMICAWNEEQIIDEKMKNCRALDYPKDKLQIMWVTDGSTDGTNKRLALYPEALVMFTPQREGKAAAMNHGMRNVKTPITVFTDANSMISSAAIKALVRAMSDPRVGCAAGEKRVMVRTESLEDAQAAGRSEGLYWKYESQLKRWDSQLCSAMGAAGELYAIRTNLYAALPHDTLLDDFVLSMLIVDKGMKIAYVPEAYAMEYGSANIKEEGKRKQRICAGGLQSVARLTGMLNPLKHPLTTFQYISHRVLRWTVTPFALIIMLAANIILSAAGQGWVYALLLILQILFWLLAAGGWIIDRCHHYCRLASAAYYFAFMNLNVFRGIRYLNVHKNNGSWERAKRG